MSINPTYKNLKNILNVRSKYKKDGFIIIRNFINKEIIKNIKDEIDNNKKTNKFFYYEKIKKKKENLEE